MVLLEGLKDGGAEMQSEELADEVGRLIDLLSARGSDEEEESYTEEERFGGSS